MDLVADSDSSEPNPNGCGDEPALFKKGADFYRNFLGKKQEEKKEEFSCPPSISTLAHIQGSLGTNGAGYDSRAHTHTQTKNGLHSRATRPKTI